MFLIALLVFSLQSFSQSHLIPKPTNLQPANDSLLFGKNISIIGSFHFEPAVEALKAYLKSDLEIDATANKTSGDNIPILIMHEDSLSVEENGYVLTIMSGGIWIETGTLKGAFAGVQTLRQLLLFSQRRNNSIVLRAGRFTDQPAFQHRGLLLDCSRHFFSVETVKKYIDLLAFYKMNTLHWHLTEDQGWRIQIDKYPKLTEVGAWRMEKDSSVYGGFYTKDQIKKVVAYAASRGVTVIPEIEMPGHAQAALASYPQFSCTGDTTIKVVNDWGVFKEIYCAGNDSTFAFLEDVLTEVMELFPSKYIHIGGDEAPKFRWEHCAKCQKRMADEGLKDEHELQSYFIQRIEKFLNAHGRELIGWDEILEGGLSPNATVQSWRGMEYGKEAAEMKHNVIMSPTSHCYLDYNLKSINLQKVYSFNLIPEGLEKEFEQYILGGEVNMWTEHVPNDSVLDSKVFPRLIAAAEVFWSGPGGDYHGFYNHLQSHYPILEKMGVKYGLEAEPIGIKSITRNDSTFIELTPGSSNLELEFSYCRSVNSIYKKPIYVNCNGNLWVRALKNDQQYGDTIQIPISKHEAMGILPKYQNQYSSYYTAGGDYGLVDGLTGTIDFRDGRWQGFSGKDLDVVIDLGEKRDIVTVLINFYEYGNAWILPPKNISLFASDNGSDWAEIDRSEFEINQDGSQKNIHDYEYKPRGLKTMRYLKVLAKNAGPLPAWHEAAGSEAWIFVDEIIVR